MKCAEFSAASCIAEGEYVKVATIPEGERMVRKPAADWKAISRWGCIENFVAFDPGSSISEIYA